MHCSYQSVLTEFDGLFRCYYEEGRFFMLKKRTATKAPQTLNIQPLHQ